MRRSSTKGRTAPEVEAELAEVHSLLAEAEDLAEERSVELSDAKTQIFELEAMFNSAVRAFWRW